MSKETWWINWLPDKVINLENAALPCSWSVGLLLSAMPGNTRGQGEVPVSGSLGFLLDMTWYERPPAACGRKPRDKPQLINKHNGRRARGAFNLRKSSYFPHFLLCCSLSTVSLCSSLCPWCINYQCCRAGAAIPVCPPCHISCDRPWTAPVVRSDWEIGMLPFASHFSCWNQHSLVFLEESASFPLTLSFL